MHHVAHAPARHARVQAQVGQAGLEVVQAVVEAEETALPEIGHVVSGGAVHEAQPK